LEVEVEAGAGGSEVTNAVRVEGGGASPAATSMPSTMPNTVEGPAATFGIADFNMQASDLGGAVDGQASGHPDSVMTLFNFNTGLEQRFEGRTLPENVHPPKDIVVSLPPGFVGDPRAAATCTAVQLIGHGGLSSCPPASRVGTALVFIEGGEGLVPEVYNMVPEKGYPAQLAFKILGKEVTLYASLVHTSSGYAVRVADTGLPRTLGIEGAGLILSGDPNAANNEPNNPHAFFTNPADCSAGPLTAKIEADSWAEPGNWVSADSVVYPQISNCTLLQFAPTLQMRPEVTEAEAPTGVDIDIKTPQSPSQFPVLATPDLKGVTMTLPEGMTIAPGAADGLVGCDATGSNGIDMPVGDHAPSVAGEGEEIGADGMSHLVAGHCPLASRIGTVQVTTPLLKEPLEGNVYLAAPQCGGAGQNACTAADATNGRLYGFYIEAESSGVVIKLGGRISADPTTGRLTARVTEIPQQPVSEVSLHIKGGPRAPLANPRRCGPAETSADLTPWSSPVTPDALPSASFGVDWNGSGEPCPATVPFAPAMTAGSENGVAGHFSPFTLELQRPDRSQDLSRLQVRMPVGLLGMLASVPLCGEPEASQGTCPAASEIGTVAAAVGSGSHPFVVTGGQVYLTGAYHGSPFGLSVVVPAVAGPFDLGNVVVRSAIDVNPSTSAITITSDPFPQFLDGVPLRIQTLKVTVDRPGFTFNPTTCANQQVTATVESAQGATAHLASPYATEGCRSLPFKPTFKVSTQAKTSKARGASLTVRVAERPGEANIQKVDLRLPVALPARLTTLQKACTAAQFEANPAGCPAASVIGTAKAITPVLKAPLQGPAYLVSHGGAAFPDVEFVLQADERGGEVQIVLDGKTQIKKGVTYSRFETVPDAPIGSFETVLPQGPHSALGTNIPAKAKGSLCGQRLTVPTTLTGQNGVVVKQNTKVAVTGCAKGKPKRAKKAGSARRSADRKRGK
jgi:hypothetical protein